MQHVYITCKNMTNVIKEIFDKINDKMNVVLNLKRANTPSLLLNFDVEKDIAEHCREAAVVLFLHDVCELTENNRELDTTVRTKAVSALQTLCLSNHKTMLSKLAGGLSCTLRVAAFAVMLSLMPNTIESAKEKDVLKWAADHCLHGNIGDDQWTLTDLMFALESVVCHWESLQKSIWSLLDTMPKDNKNLNQYLDYVWQECKHFVVSTPTTKNMNSSSHTLPYNNSDMSTGHEIAVSPAAVSTMCEIWRQTTLQLQFRWELDNYAAMANAETMFLSAFAFEKNQLSVDKFREKLRVRLAQRHLMLGDEQIWSAKQGGKAPELDLVVGERCPLAMPGYFQTATASWTFEKMQQHELVRDELYRMMADSAFTSRTQMDFSLRYFEDVGVAKIQRKNVHLVKRICHGFAVVRCDFDGKQVAVTPPLPFAAAFMHWCGKAVQQGGQQYGADVLSIANTCLQN